jgi:hypothetical protein
MPMQRRGSQLTGTALTVQAEGKIICTCAMLRLVRRPSDSGWKRAQLLRSACGIGGNRSDTYHGDNAVIDAETA